MNNPVFTPAATLWAATAPARAAAPALAAPLEIDAAVVGGGFTGLSAALHLAEAGLRVALFETHEVAHRASGRNGGQVVPGFKPGPAALARRFGAETAARMTRFAYGNADYLFELVERLRIDCAPTRNGWIQGAFSAASADYLRRRAQELNAHGGDVEYLDAEAMRAATGSSFWPAGLRENAPARYSRWPWRAAWRARPRRPAPRCTSARRWPPSSRATAAAPRSASTAMPCRRATWCWPPTPTPTGCGPRWRSPTSTWPAPRSPPSPAPALQARLMPLRAGISETRKITYYCRIDPEGRFVIGGRGHSSEQLDPSTREQLRRAAVARFPELADAAWRYGWACRVGMTLDDLPRLHRLAPGVWTAYGYCGRGVAMGTALGRVLRDAIRGVPAERLDFPVTPISRMPGYPARQFGATLAINWYRLRDALGFPA